MFNRNVVRCTSAFALAVTVFAGCREDPLAVENPNQPDIDLALGTPINAEAVVSKSFQQMFNGQFGSSDDIYTQAVNFAFESSSQLGNFGMGTRSLIPRTQIDNQIGNSVAPGNFRDWDHLSRNTRATANALAAIDAFIAAGNPIGTDARNARARSFGYFALGYGLGYLAMTYDSAVVVTPQSIPAEGEVPPLASAAVVMQAALRMLDSAVAIAGGPGATAAQVTAAAGTGGWPIPKEWFLSGNSTFGAPVSGPDRTNWIRLVRSMRARFRANVARTPIERAAVDWAAVVADATAGITDDVVLNIDVLGGWSMSPIQQFRVSASWSQLPMFVYGMADTLQNYDVFLQLCKANPNATSCGPTNAAYRGAANACGGTTPCFLMRTPDRRWPVGNTRAEQQLNSGGTAKIGPPSGSVNYFRMRPTGDDAGNWPWGVWFYDNHRFWVIGAAGGNGPFVLMSKTESDMLAAEGHLRLGNDAAAVALINISRARASLPAIPATATRTTLLTGTACVPRVPQPPAYTTTACGDVWEAMKYEKRMETSFTAYAPWYYDSRAWGDLFSGTPLEWPVPYQELFARLRPTYQNTNVATAAKGFGTYGW